MSDHTIGRRGDMSHTLGCPPIQCTGLFERPRAVPLVVILRQEEYVQ